MSDPATDVQPKPKPSVPADTHPNFFAPVAELMRSIPAALEAQGPTGGAPRYVRIARLRRFLKPVAPKDEKLAAAMSTGVEYFITGMAYVMKYTLKLQDLLVQGDAGKALVETALAFAETVTKKDFLDSIEDLNNNLLEGSSLGLKDSMTSVGGHIDDVKKYVSYIPEPHDLEVIGQQLYRMMVIEWTAAPTAAGKAAEPALVVDMTKTGKLRLLLWALNKPFKPLDTGASPDVTDIKILGRRPLWSPTTAKKLPEFIKGQWKGPEQDSELEDIFDTPSTGEDATADIRELQNLLKAYGYPLDVVNGSFDAVTKNAVKEFQRVNLLKETGEVDLPTVNQLFHLRYDPDQAKGGLRKAKRYVADVKDVPAV